MSPLSYWGQAWGCQCPVLRGLPPWEGLAQQPASARCQSMILGFPPLQSAGSRGDQARQLLIDLETRGKQAFPVFLSILRDTGQGDLADMLTEECGCPSAPPQLVDLRPVELELRGEEHPKSKTRGCDWFQGKQQRVGW
uniref:CARD domain-containing protein n=1 Tax=Amazona collaria TaxID=241587 RepID=A0A8B9FQL6_9PSIT